MGTLHFNDNFHATDWLEKNKTKTWKQELHDVITTLAYPVTHTRPQ